jgi:hypothetical protein
MPFSIPFSTNDSYLVPGMVQSCFNFDSLLLSTLECYYFNFCIQAQSVLLLGDPHFQFTNQTEFQMKPLVYTRETSRFPPNISLSVIIKSMMIEQWNASSSFDHYYETCAPIYCTYSYTKRTFTFIGIVIKLFSIVGGLMLVLRLITPQIVKIIFSLLKPKIRMRRAGNFKLMS